MPESDESRFLSSPWTCGVLLVLSTAAVLLRTGAEAWIGEDALITFRTIDNFVSGHGLRWNIDERVQVYTHPLWMLLNIATYAITREIPYTLTAVSLVLSVSAYVVVACRFTRRPVLLLLSFWAPFMASRAIILYGTSGFETPLSFLLLAVFTVVLLPKEGSRPVHWGWLSLIAALAAVNRLDHILLYAPPLIYLCLTNWRCVRWGRLVLGMSPLIAWLVFSFLYHGFFLPNTSLAKLSDEIPTYQYVREGVLYTADLVRWDLVSAPILVMALGICGSALVRSFSERGNRRAGCLAALGSGVFLYGGYILYVGGGFLSGRFWAPPLFAAILVISFGIEDFIRHLRAARARTAAAAMVCMAVLLLTVHVLAQGLRSYQPRGPIFERSLAHLYLKPDLTWGITEVAAYWRADGLRLQRRAQATPARHVAISAVIGFQGLAAGSEVTIIDEFALADPFLARLPPGDPASWAVAHIHRPIPVGYVFARRTGSLARMDAPLREYYRHLRLVVSGPIFDRERLYTMVGFLFGRYDHFIDEWRVSKRQ